MEKERKVREESCFRSGQQICAGGAYHIVFCLSVDLDQSEALISF